MADEKIQKLSIDVEAQLKTEGFEQGKKRIEDFNHALNDTSESSSEASKGFGDLSDKAKALGEKLGKVFSVKDIANAKKLADLNEKFNSGWKANTLEGVESGFEAMDVKGLAESLNQLNSTQRSTLTSYATNVAKVREEIEKLNEKLKEANKAPTLLGKAAKAVGRIVVYRAIRAAMTAIVKQMKEGVSYVREYSKAVGKLDKLRFAEKLDKINAEVKAIQLNLGVGLASTLTTLEPVISNLLQKTNNLVVGINRTFAAFGNGKYIEANTKYLEEYTSALKKASGALQGFDELNNISMGFDYGKAFQEVDMSDLEKTEQKYTAIKKIAQEVDKFFSSTMGNNFKGFELLVDGIYLGTQTVKGGVEEDTNAAKEQLGVWGSIKEKFESFKESLSKFKSPKIEIPYEYVNVTPNNDTQTSTTTTNNNATTTEKKSNAFIDAIKKATEGVGKFFDSVPGKILKGVLGGPIFPFASGGFPTTGSLFIAGESGAELVGTVGGQTAVAGGMEITGIREAVYDAANSIIAQMRNTSTNVILEGDAKQMFRVVQNEAQNYTLSTGRMPF